MQHCAPKALYLICFVFTMCFAPLLHSSTLFKHVTNFNFGRVHDLSMFSTGWLWTSSPSSLPPPLTPSLRPHPTSCDVYLGGSCGATSWRADDVIPILRQYGVTFFNPQIADWNVSLIPVEQRAREQVRQRGRGGGGRREGGGMQNGESR